MAKSNYHFTAVFLLLVSTNECYSTTKLYAVTPLSRLKQQIFEQIIINNTYQYAFIELVTTKCYTSLIIILFKSTRHEDTSD